MLTTLLMSALIAHPLSIQPHRGSDTGVIIDYADPSVPTGTYALHRVQGRETLFSIGQRFGVDWRNIADLNQIRSPEHVSPGLLLLVPLQSPQSPQSPQFSRPPPSYPSHPREDPNLQKGNAPILGPQFDPESPCHY